MSDLLQTGYHPDADQLSAFAEQALPAHEHADVLAHLTSCPDCRAVVFLALPPQEPVAESAPELILTPTPAPSPRRWFSGWNLAWPVAAAFAVLLLTLVLRRQTTSAPSSVSNQVAVATAPAPPVPAPATPQATRPVAGAGQLQAAPATLPPPQLSAAQASPQPTLESRDVKDLPLNGRNTMELLKVLPGAVAAGQSSNAESTHATAGMPPPPSAPPPTSASALQASLDASANASATVFTGTAMNALSSESALRLQPLPSHLEVLSTAISGTQVLALDSAHALFLSDDNGQHWRTIRPAWKGQAAHVALVSQPMAAGAAPVIVRTAEPPPALIYDRNSAPPRPALSAPVGAAAPAAPFATEASSLSGTVTDPVGASVPGATVTLTNTATSASTKIPTDSAGHYTARLLAGDYRIQVLAPGFAPSEVAATLAAAQPSVHNFTLAVGAVSQSVTVTSAAPVLQTEQSQLSTVLRGATREKSQAPLFVITTDAGVRWTSADGEHWKRQ